MSFIFFYAGVKFRRIGFLFNKGDNIKSLSLGFAIMTSACVVGFLLSWPDIDMYTCKSDVAGYLSYAALALPMVAGFLLICRVINHVPFISYVGRHSIILLGLHNIILGVLVNVCNSLMGLNSPWPGTAITILLCAAMIPVCKRHLPHLTAQKELLPIIRTHIKKLTLRS